MEIQVKRDDSIVTVVLNRPEKLNALTKAMWRNLDTAFMKLSKDDTIRCIVVRGAGDRAFSPGNDISEFKTERCNSLKAREYGTIMAKTLEAIKSCRHPIVAMIQGVCVGGGLEIASLCDIRVCGQSSRFGIPVNRLGLVMSLAELVGLVNLVGRAVAVEILLEGRVFGSEEALSKGLVTRIVPDGDVENEAYASAERIASGAPLVNRWHKEFLNRLADPALISEREIMQGYECFDTEDFQIGYQAFLNKREPRFKGR
ncbi:enoyl-CoA hydratase-related protein [bacterium]|nr:enoyl-CoA hydratase-related protein [bacterium]